MYPEDLITAAIKHIKVGAALALPNWGAASSAPTSGLCCLIAGVITSSLAKVADGIELFQ